MSSIFGESIGRLVEKMNLKLNGRSPEFEIEKQLMRMELSEDENWCHSKSIWLPQPVRQLKNGNTVNALNSKLMHVIYSWEWCREK